MNNSYFYKDKPLFGMDIGYSSVKVMQIECQGHTPTVIGYGVGDFDSKAIKDGVIVDHKILASSVKELFEKGIVGHINTRRVALALPATRTFTRTMNLPPISDDELPEAVTLEAEQYIPMPIDDLYIDHTIINRSDKGVELLAVAVPKKIVDSYMLLVRMLGLEPVAFDTSILAAARIFEKRDSNNSVPAVLIDFGSLSADITIHDGTVIVTGTIPGGGDIFTDLIAKKLGVSKQEAHLIKTKYGIGKSKKQDQILEALQPSLDQLVKEIRRMLRYYEDRADSSKQKIGQVVTMGGGANMPGLSEHLTSVLRIPARTCDPWQNIRLHKLQPPGAIEKTIYVTVAGLCMIESKELFL
jgi:type IV pilus assembly protein PilM